MNKQFTNSLQSTRGVVVPLAAISILVLILLCGLAVDGARAFRVHNNLQTIVDAATISGTYQLLQQDSQSVVVQTEEHVLKAVQELGETIDEVDEEQDIYADTDGRTLKTAATVNLDTFFIRILPGFETLPIRATATASRPPLRGSLILDVSGSMWGAKIEALKAATHHFVSRLDENVDRISIVKFGEDATLLWSAGQALNKNQIYLKINTELNVSPGGSTCVSCGLKLGIDDLVEANQVNAVRFMLFMTDGVPSEQAAVGNEETEITTCTYPNANEYTEPGMFNRGATMQALAQANRAKKLGLQFYVTTIGEKPTYCNSPTPFPHWEPGDCGCTAPPENESHWGAYRDEDDNLYICTGESGSSNTRISPILMAEISNNPDVLTDIVFKPADPTLIPSLEDCELYASHPASWVDEWEYCACHRRVGPEVPEGVYVHIQNPDDLTPIFEVLYQHAAKRIALTY